MRVFVTDEFDQFVRSVGLSDADLIKSASEIESGLFDANLGGVLKKRMAAKGESKRNANRCIVAFKLDDRLFFVDGWRKADVPKKGKEIPDKLLDVYRELAKSLLSASWAQLAKDVKAGLLREIDYE
jgi:hypothetical protein